MSTTNLLNSKSVTANSNKSVGGLLMLAGVLVCVVLSFLTGTGQFVAAAFAVMLVLGLICSMNDTEPTRWTL